MRADIKRKPFELQEFRVPVYRCVSFCMTYFANPKAALPALWFAKLNAFSL